MFSLNFMIVALVAIILLSITLPILGLNMTTKRMSMIGDTLAHTSLVGIAIGLACGTLPTVWAIATSILAGLIIELVRNKLSKYAELTLAIVMSASVGVVGIMTSIIKGNSIEKYLFGTILNISNIDLWIIVGLSIFVLLFSIFFYRTNLYISYNSDEAKIAGRKVVLMNIINSIVVSTTIAISSSIIGSLLVSSFLVIPVAIALQLFKGYFQILICSISISVINGFLGLVTSYYANINSGGTIVVFNIIVLILVLLLKFLVKIINKNKLKRRN